MNRSKEFTAQKSQNRPFNRCATFLLIYWLFLYSLWSLWTGSGWNGQKGTEWEWSGRGENGLGVVASPPPLSAILSLPAFSSPHPRQESLFTGYFFNLGSACVWEIVNWRLTVFYNWVTQHHIIHISCGTQNINATTRHTQITIILHQVVCFTQAHESAYLFNRAQTMVCLTEFCF